MKTEEETTRTYLRIILAYLSDARMSLENKNHTPAATAAAATHSTRREITTRTLEEIYKLFFLSRVALLVKKSTGDNNKLKLSTHSQNESERKSIKMIMGMV